LIAVVIGAKNKKIRFRQTKEILDYGFRKLGYDHYKSMVESGLPNSGK